MYKGRLITAKGVQLKTAADMLKGVYTLIIELQKGRDITIGKLGAITFSRGYYVYVGSAFNGLEARLGRHLRKEKKLNWHIDYFLKKGKVEEIIYSVTVKKKECAVARDLARKLSAVPRFGCSDCRCISHLYFSVKKDKVRKSVKKCFGKSDLVPFQMIEVSSRSFSMKKFFNE